MFDQSKLYHVGCIVTDAKHHATGVWDLYDAWYSFVTETKVTNSSYYTTQYVATFAVCIECWRNKDRLAMLELADVNLL